LTDSNTELENNETNIQNKKIKPKKQLVFDISCCEDNYSQNADKGIHPYIISKHEMVKNSQKLQSVINIVLIR